MSSQGAALSVGFEFHTILVVKSESFDFFTKKMFKKNLQ